MDGTIEKIGNVLIGRITDDIALMRSDLVCFMCGCGDLIRESHMAYKCDDMGMWCCMKHAPPDVQARAKSHHVNDEKSIARIGYGAYTAATGGFTWDHRLIPPFARLGDTRSLWEAAAIALLSEYAASGRCLWWIAYKAYYDASGGKTFDGKQMPTANELDNLKWANNDPLPHGHRTRSLWFVFAFACVAEYERRAARVRDERSIGKLS